MKQIINIFLLLLIVGCTNDNKKRKIAEQTTKVVTLPFFNSAEFTPEWIQKGTKAYKEIHQIPDFSFFNQNGELVTKNDYLGKIYVANFFFTSCTGICRDLSLNMRLIQEKFKGDDEVKLLSHSVTPEIDSVPVLKKYATDYKINSEQWNLVTGDKEAIYELARTAYFSDEDFVKTEKPSEFIHTENLLLVDKKGRIRGVYNGTIKLATKRLMKHIELLKNEE